MKRQVARGALFVCTTVCLACSEPDSAAIGRNMPPARNVNEADPGAASQPNVTAVEGGAVVQGAPSGSALPRGTLREGSSEPIDGEPALGPALPATPVPGYPCAQEGESAEELPRILQCGCSLDDRFTCIGGSLQFNLPFCPNGVAPGDASCTPPQQDFTISGCFLEDPAGIPMQCRCVAELVWSCW